MSLSPKGPAARRSFANCRAYGVTKFSKNADAAKAFLEALVDNYREGAKASTGYNMPFLKNYAKPPFPIISEDPKLKPLEQDAEYHFTTGYPGPLTPAADEVYQQFVMVDALAQYCVDKLDLEAGREVGRGEDQGDSRQVRVRCCPQGWAGRTPPPRTSARSSRLRGTHVRESARWPRCY